jgi:hypothetical protein
MGAMDCDVTVNESGKRLTWVATLPEITQVVTVNVPLYTPLYIPPPCKGDDAFSSFRTIHWGDGVDLSPGEHSHTAGKVRGSTTSSKEGGRGVGQSFHWGDGLLRNGSRILGKRLAQVAVLPLIMQVVTVTVLLPPMYIPPPCKTCTSHHNGQDN